MAINRLTEEAAGGLAAGILGTIIGFPLDLIKTRMQTSSSKVSVGILSTGRAVVKREGFLALYKGVVPPLLSLSILNTLNFSSYSVFQDILGADRGWDWRNAVAGGSCGPIASIVSTTENLLKTQMQVDNVTAKRFTGTLDCIKKLTNEHGLPVLYTGHGINTAREVTFLMTYFWVYEGIRKELISNTAPGSGKWVIPAAGGMAGAIAWTTSFPLDCVRAGVQGRRDLTVQRGALDVLKELLQRKGLKGLYSGVAPSVVRAFIVSGSRFSAYEAVLWILRGGRDAGVSN